MIPLINVKNLTVHRNNNAVIKNLSFDIEAGDFLCVVGTNGSGKTTLIKTLIGELKPTSGSILFSPEIKPHAIGYLPQNTQIDHNVPATVFEIITTGCLNQSHFINKKSKQKITRTIKLLHLESIQNQSFSELS